MDFYQLGIRPFLFSALKADPEYLHHQAMRAVTWLHDTGDRPPVSWLQTRLQHTLAPDFPALHQTLWGVPFSNPVGLAAGFDKNGEAGRTWSCFGFGFAEMGTVTFHAQPGNPRPRMFRLIEDQAALNRMGFNNEGAAALAQRLKVEAENHFGQKQAPFPLGINLGKSKITPLEEAAEDYRSSFHLLKALGDYFVVNVSSPNTPGLRALQDADQLDRILGALQQENTENRPLLVKIAPDLEWGAIADILSLVETHRLAGIIATNTTISREGLKTQVLEATGQLVTEEAGGISGAPVRQRSTEIIRYIYEKTEGRVPIIGVGGIFTAEDAWEKITVGASLVQLYTGWIYEGPYMLRRILEGLVRRLEDHNLSSIQEAIGLSHRQ
ncbi:MULTISPECIES: quinone-dependent dihydroorotate dehydrogenase [unclassified Leptolyngbya]|uniref:quinone-dependent dihydroorotate dehydrogenase n=1 Tax=unclassified Leptolyngbya TaxID=2650499 RepID=UPI0016899AEE|nr:quinone-dependent dihydroorotate dehydrogenase [Leptolyngbya sp. FACHB-8]MBD2154580.1 quinone-dependent dihydroorotate dehydrogenase [Leptolyngbya sp. FACHB-16]